jgi:hypothetical protein
MELLKHSESSLGIDDIFKGPVDFSSTRKESNLIDWKVGPNTSLEKVYIHLLHHPDCY